jgi:hypothetical protein
MRELRSPDTAGGGWLLTHVPGDKPCWCPKYEVRPSRMSSVAELEIR